MAKVEGSAISGRLLNHWVSLDETAHGAAIASRTVSRRRTLGFLISARWLLGEAHELGINVSNGQAKKQLALFEYYELEGMKYGGLPKDVELRTLLESAKATAPDRLWLMKLSMLATRVEERLLTQARHAVTRAEIARFYAKNRRRFVVPEKRDVEILGSYEKDVIRKARQEIESGTDFLRVARRVSIDMRAPGGLRLGLERGQEHYDKAIFAAKPGILVGPRKYVYYVLFKVLSIVPRHQQTLAQAIAEIRRQLAAGPGLRGLVAESMRRWIRRTSCRAGYVIMGCRQYVGISPAHGHAR